MITVTKILEVQRNVQGQIQQISTASVALCNQEVKLWLVSMIQLNPK